MSSNKDRVIAAFFATNFRVYRKWKTEQQEKQVNCYVATREKKASAISERGCFCVFFGNWNSFNQIQFVQILCVFLYSNGYSVVVIVIETK